MVDDPLTEKIIGCAFTVYNTLGAGFLESVYKQAMAIELHKARLPFIIEAPIEVYYDKTMIGFFFADVIVNGQVILELKAIEAINKVHEIQLVNYLKATNTPTGLLINFGPQDISFKRKFRDYTPSEKKAPGR
ncbi:MAG: GxxExxY protein [Rectinemataceae bacterium]